MEFIKGCLKFVALTLAGCVVILFMSVIANVINSPKSALSEQDITALPTIEVQPTITASPREQYRSHKSVLAPTLTRLPMTSDVMVAVVSNKISNPEQYDNPPYGRTVDIQILVTNKSEKDIKAAQGIVSISNVFGEEVLKVRTLFDSKVIYANSKTQFDFVLKVNPFNESDMKIYNTDFDYLVFDVDISNIIFTDGSTITFRYQ